LNGTGPENLYPVRKNRETVPQNRHAPKKEQRPELAAHRQQCQQ
jgi:hypothetical protein